MNLQSRFLLIFALLFFVLACNTTHIKPPKPTNINYTEPAKPTSCITIPIVLDLKAISKDLNALYLEKYYTDDSYDNNDNDNLKVTVVKSAPLYVSSIGNHVFVTAPMRIEGSYRINKKVLGMNVTYDQGFKFNLTVDVQTLPVFDKNWNLKLNSKSNIRWEDLPNFEVAGLQIDFPKMFGKIIQGQVDKITTQLDQELANTVDLRKVVNDGWKQAIQPIGIDVETNSWLIIRPKQVFYTQLEGFDSLAKFNLGLYSVIEIVSGYKPLADTSSVLPFLYQTNKLDDKINLMLNIQISFDQINQTIQQQLIGKSIKLESKEYKLDILDAKVFGNTDKILIGVNVTGKVKRGVLAKKIKGIVYFEGTPVYNIQKQTISVKNFELNIQTKDVLLKSASWLANSKLFKNSIESKLEFSIAKELKDAIKIANEAVNKQYGKKLQFNGVINQITPTDIFVTPNAVRVNIKALGKIGLKLNGF